MNASDIRTDLISRIAAIDGGNVWTPTKLSSARFPNKESNKTLHKHFAVSILDTTASSDAIQSRSQPIPVQSTVEVKFTFVLPATSKDQSDAENEAIASEEMVRKTVSGATGYHTTYVRTLRQNVFDDTYMMMTLTFTVLHEVSHSVGY